MIIDILLVLLAGIGFWLGYARGLVRTLFAVVCYALALVLTLWISPWIMQLMLNWFHPDKMFALVFGTIGTMIVLILLLHWMLKSVEKYLKKGRLGGISKSIGGVLMMLLAMVVCSFLVLAFVSMGWVGAKTKSSSYSYPALQEVPVRTRTFIAEFKPLFRRYWDLMQQTAREPETKNPTE